MLIAPGHKATLEVSIDRSDFSKSESYHKPCNKAMFTLYPNDGVYFGVSKNRGIPKWMVYNGKPY